LCSTYKCASPALIKNHLRVIHKVSNVKILPLDGLKTNPDEDFFVGTPKNGLPRGMNLGPGARAKDTFSPDEIEVKELGNSANEVIETT